VSIARRVPSVPVLTASATWDRICGLLTPTGEQVRTDLVAIADLASMAIAERYTSDAPIVVTGAGAQIRIRTLHGDEAIQADSDISPLYGHLTGTGWILSLPVGDQDFEYAEKITVPYPRIQVRRLDAALPTADDVAGPTAVIDPDVLAAL
jgi:hypothetical protein